MPTTEVSLALREVRGSDAELLHLSALLAAMDGEAPLPLATMRERYATMRRYPDYRCYMMWAPMRCHWAPSACWCSR
ncbi:hypothetical protein FHX61_004016 [Cupriavidus alkaliphilus]|uniref:Uncharacterized protein n=1 Tax=Cupriavidus alkaliphilus TaxID=942866 RepID=A0A7W4YS66_9BURK|nr:hypothetical protein [Cupriavidus alkaliphilus]